MISMAKAAKKYELSYHMVHNWVSSGYIETVPDPEKPGSRGRVIEYQEEQVLAAMAALHHAGVSTKTAVFLARGSTPHIARLDRALDKCKVVRASHRFEASGG